MNERSELTTHIERYRDVQGIARTVLDEMRSFIEPGMTEKSIAEYCDALLKQNGAESFWYHNVGSMVFVGQNTTLAVSGRDYLPTETKVAANDLVTIDVSPAVGAFWGDCARSFIIGDNADGSELGQGTQYVRQLHSIFRGMPVTSTFEFLYSAINAELAASGYENLDFRGNLGHTIEKEIDSRQFIELGSKVTLEEAGLFTFEPHIRKIEGRFGFRFEEIYFAENGKIQLL